MSVLKHMLCLMLPHPKKLNDRVGEDDLVYRLGYGLFWFNVRAELAKWHRRELLRCDPEFERREEVYNLVHARREAQERGISALDPRYPRLNLKFDQLE